MNNTNYKYKNSTKPKHVKEGVTTQASTVSNNASVNNSTTNTNTTTGTCGSGNNLIWIILGIFFVIVLILGLILIFFKAKNQPGGFEVGGPSFKYQPPNAYGQVPPGVPPPTGYAQPPPTGYSQPLPTGYTQPPVSTSVNYVNPSDIYSSATNPNIYLSQAYGTSPPVSNPIIVAENPNL